MSTPPLPTPSVVLNRNNLTVAKEGTYFGFVLTISILVWLLLAVSIVGIFYALIFAFFLWMGNGMLIAYLRSEAVQVSEDQLPELDRTFKEVCEHMGLEKRPALYVLQAGGLLNAFATRFSGRNFVVIYSDFLEALGPSSPEMKFVLGHEIGHIQSRHITKQIFLAPGMFFPLVGPAYRRAWETSCDRFGTYAAQDVDAAVRAMLVITGGREHGRRLNPEAFAGQHSAERGFFVSLHELTSTYPTLSRRVTDLVALKGNEPAVRPRRSALAYLLAMFMPGGNLGSGGSAGGFLVVVVVIGLMAAMAIPAFQKVRESSIARACINNQRMLAAALDQYRLEHGAGAQSWEDIIGPGKLITDDLLCLQGGSYSGELTEDGGGYVVTCSIETHDPYHVHMQRAPATER